MAYCITTMIITANNEENYKTVLEWCDLFNADDRIQTFAPQYSNENFSVQYDELNINQSEAGSVFKAFARYCIENNVTGGAEVYFDVSFGNGGEEYQLLYKLENGEATEMVSYFDDLEEYGDDEITIGYKSGDTDSVLDKREAWHDNPEYSSPIKIKLYDEEDSDDVQNGPEMNEVFDATNLILETMDKNGIHHDEHTLENISTRDAYDILAGTYDPDAARPTYKASDFKGKNIVLSGIRGWEAKDNFQATVEWLGGIEQSEVGPDTDFVVYNEKEGKEGKPYRVATELKSKGQNITLVPFEDFIWLYMDPQPDDAYGKNEAEGSTDEFIIEDGVLKKYAGSSKEVVVPAGCTAIGNGAFEKSEIIKVTLPQGLQEIGNHSFTDCLSLKEVVLPETIQSIGSFAFEFCESMEKIILPDGLNSIEHNAFAYCEALEEVKLPENCRELDDFAFFDCKSIKNLLLPKNIKKIGGWAFQGCGSLIEIKFPDGLEEIGKCAFMDCTSLTQIMIPESVRKIGPQAFYNCRSLRVIENYSDERLLYGYILRMPADETFPPKASDEILPSVISGFMPNENFEELKPAEKRIAVNCYLSSSERYPEDKREAYESYIRKQSGRLLTDYAQQGEIDLLKKLLRYDYIKLPALQKTIEAAGANNDVRVMLTDYLNAHFSRDDVEKNAQKSQNLAPKKLSESEQLKKIWSYKKLDDGTLCITSYKGKDTNITVPALIGKSVVTEIGEKAFSSEQGHCKNESIRSEITNVVISEGIVKIGESAFANCPQLTSIRLPDSLRTIEQGAFWGCAKLEHVILPEGLIKIGDRTFECCWGLNGLTIPSTVETVGYSIIAFNKIISDVYILSESVQFLTDAFFDDKHAFSYVLPQLTIHGIKGSTAEEYANKYGFKFEKLE